MVTKNQTNVVTAIIEVKIMKVARRASEVTSYRFVEKSFPLL